MDLLKPPLKRRDEKPDKYSPAKIAAETGMPLAVLLEVTCGLLDRNNYEV